MKKLLVLIAVFALALPAHAMVTPVFGTIDTSLPVSANNNTYFPYDTGAGSTARTSNSSDANARELAPIAGTISDLSVSLPGSPGVGSSYIFQLYVNGSTTASLPNCTIADSATSCNDSAHPFQVYPTDTLTWFVGSTTNPTLRTPSISSTFTSTNTGESPVMATFAPSNTVTNYFSPVGAGGSTVEASSSAVVPLNGTIDNLYVQQAGTPGATKSMAYTLYHNGSPTSVTCTVSNTATTCNDLTGADGFTVAPGDTLSMQTVPSGTPSSQITRYSFRLRPTTDGESPIWVIRTSNVPSGTRYAAIFGTGNQNTTEANETTVAPTAFTFKSLYVIVDKTNPSGSWTWTDRKNAGSLTLTCSIGTPNTTCNDTTHTSDTYAQNNTIDWQVLNPSGDLFNYMKVAAVAYIAPSPGVSTTHGYVTLTNGVMRIINGLFTLY